ncbi:MAG: SDR family oxidoreductase [Halobacteriovoraceae bacterium]|nr:SDR family oxidoreductase [Halobacteriovoraceae bacterium]
MKIVIIGGSSGIGKGCALSLINEGHEVIVGSRTEPENSELKSRWKALDVTNESSVVQFFQEINSQMGSLDGLVYSAGISRPKENPKDFNLEGHEEIYSVNVTGALLCIKHSVSVLEINKGSIVLISSIAARTASDFSSISYTASKAALGAIVRQYSSQLASKKIRINSVLPSMTRTPMLEKILGADKIQEISKALPLEELADVEDVVKPIKFLLNKDSSYMTGVGLDISGGLFLNG